MCACASEIPKNKTCHCHHIEQWMRELLRIVLRIEQRLYSSSSLNPRETEDEEENKEIKKYVAMNAEEVEAIFLGFKENENMMKNCVTQAKDEVSKNKKKSIERILLSMAPPDAWKEFSKLGARGKRSAMAIGLHQFLYACLRKVGLSFDCN